jgi:hypothetical protein
MPSSVMWVCVGLVKSEVSEELVASIFWTEEIYGRDEKC